MTHLSRPIGPLFSRSEKVFFGASIAVLLIITSVACVSLFTKDPYLLERSFPLRKKSCTILGGSGLALLSGLLLSAIIIKQKRVSTRNHNLIKESRNGNLANVEALLGAGVNPNTRSDGFDSTPLISATRMRRHEVITALLNAGADPNVHRDRDGYTALMIAAKEGQTEIVKALLEAEADPNIWDGLTRTLTALMYAAEAGHLEIVKALLEAGADPNILYAGITPLILHTKSGSPCNRASALMIAAMRGRTEVVKALLEAGANPDVQEDRRRYTALMFAADAGYLKVVRTLLHAHPDLSLVNFIGHTAKNLVEEALYWRQKFYAGRPSKHPLILKLLTEAEKERAVAELYATLCHTLPRNG